MSNEFAIAAVTRTLRNLLNPIISYDFSSVPADTRPTAEILITTLPPDRARNGDESRNQVNLFLYHTAPNAAWRNMDLPRRVRPGETGFSPLPLNLHYMVTTYGQDNNELIAHLLLGVAMSILHDHAVLGRAEIEAALAASELHQQVERVRITPQSVSLDETSKLWTGFQAEYRLSAAYEVAVVLIESRQPTRAPLPVLQRGQGDRGVFTVASASPTLQAVQPPNRKASAEPGDTLTGAGAGLDSENLTVRLRHPLLPDPLELVPLPGRTATTMQIELPDTAVNPQLPAQWPAGFYTLAAVVQRPGLPAWTSNALAPQITGLSPATLAVGALPAALTLTCIPQIRPEQRVSLLFGDREIPADTVTTPADPTAETTLAFTLADADPNEYIVRLRVDGVDSIPVLFSDTAPPQFDDAQKVTITP